MKLRKSRLMSPGLISVLVAVGVTLMVALPGGCASQNATTDTPENQAPEFTLAGLDGEEVSLTDVLEEKKVLLVFGTTWCPPCVRSVPELKKLYEELEDEDSDHQATLLSINKGESPEKVADFVRKHGITYPVLLDRKNEVAQAYRVVGVPTYVVVKKDRTVAYTGHSLPEARRRLIP